MMTRKYTLIFLLVLLIVPRVWAAPPEQSGPIPIRFGETVIGTLNDEQAEVSYVFDAALGDQITAILIPLSGDLDPALDLSTFDGALLATDDNGGANGGAIITYVVPGNSAYMLKVRRSAANLTTAGDFQLTLSLGALAPPPEETPESVFDAATETETPAPIVTQPPVVTVQSSERLQQLTPNSSVQGSLESGTNFDLYWFMGQSGQQIILTPEATSSFQPLLVLYQSDFTEIFRSQPGEALNATLNANGLYFIVAAAVQQGTGGAYGFRFTEPNATPTSPAATTDGLVYGDTFSGTINNINPTLRQRFRGGAGDTVTINMRALSGDLDSYLLLVDSSGTTLIENDNKDATTTDAEIVFTLPAEGDYFIIAARRGREQGITAGDFVMTLESDAPPRFIPSTDNTIPEAYRSLPQMDYGDTLQGNLTNVVFQNFYTFYGNAGDRVEISMTATETLDTYLILLDNELIPIAEHDDISETNKNSQVEFTLTRDGYYGIVATRFDQQEGVSQGGYELSLNLAGSSNIDRPVVELLAPTRLSSGETPSGEFDPLRFAQVYTFSAAEGTFIDFSVTADGGTVATVILTDGNLNFIEASDNGILLAVEAPRSDDYLVFVAPQAGPAANVAGSYIVALNADGGTSVSQVEIPIAYGATVRGRITDDVTEVSYVFQGREGDIVEISMTAEADANPLDCYLMLEDAGGTLLTENDDVEPGVVRNSFIRFTLPTDGEYRIVATRYSGETGPITTGNYTLSLQFLDPTFAGVDREATLLSYGQSVTETIDAETFVRFFYFEGEQNDQITIQVDTVDGNLDGVMYLYALTSTDDFVLLTANDDSPLGNTYDPYITYTLPRSGGYMIVVTRFEETAAEPTSGTFTLTLLIDNPSQ